jgi:ketosteroid isomerase-like protein
MYLRFVVSELDEDSNKELGVFHAIGHLRETGKLYSYEEYITTRFVNGLTKI